MVNWCTARILLYKYDTQWNISCKLAYKFWLRLHMNYMKIQNAKLGSNSLPPCRSGNIKIHIFHTKISSRKQRAWGSRVGHFLALSLSLSSPSFSLFELTLREEMMALRFYLAQWNKRLGAPQVTWARRRQQQPLNLCNPEEPVPSGQQEVVDALRLIYPETYNILSTYSHESEQRKLLRSWKFMLTECLPQLVLSLEMFFVSPNPRLKAPHSTTVLGHYLIFGLPFLRWESWVRLNAVLQLVNAVAEIQSFPD